MPGYPEVAVIFIPKSGQMRAKAGKSGHFWMQDLGPLGMQNSLSSSYGGCEKPPAGLRP
jgi:hypothetical protein